MEQNEVTRIEKMLDNLALEKGIEEKGYRAKVNSFEEGTTSYKMQRIRFRYQQKMQINKKK